MGNFDWVYRTHYEEAYRPFLDAMAAHPTLPFSLHISGPLLEWLLRDAPDYLDQVRRMVATGQVEMKGGAFFEAILAAIPDPDKAAQLERMNAFLAEHLGVHAAGAWLAERVWEPHLALPLADAGLQYAVLDDSHFLAAGLPPEATYGYYVTEEQGRRFDLFPISKDLRYLIPFHEPAEVLAFLKQLPAGRTTVPEAPGSSPRKLHGGRAGRLRSASAGRLRRRRREVRGLARHEGARVRARLARAFPDRPGRSAGVGLAPRDHARASIAACTAPLGRIYLPTGSYAEMIEWSGGFYRNFLVRYPEANRLHKRMLLTSRRVRSGLPTRTATPTREPRTRPPAGHPMRPRPPTTTSSARSATMPTGTASSAVSTFPTCATRRTPPCLRPNDCCPRTARPATEVLDFDLDGEDEVFLHSPELTAVVSPASGGTLLALDHLPSAFALMDTLRRRREPEHLALEELAVSGPRDVVPGDGSHAQTIHEGVRMKEPGLEKLLYVDRWPRTSLLDHFFEQSAGWIEMQEARARDLGDFPDGRFEVSALDTTAYRPDRAMTPTVESSVILHRRGRVGRLAAYVQKRIALGGGPGLVKVDYQIEFREDADSPWAWPAEATPPPSHPAGPPRSPPRRCGSHPSSTSTCWRAGRKTGT